MTQVEFENRHIDCIGRYHGPNLREYGFTYQEGEYVPVAARYEAAHGYSLAVSARKRYSTLTGLSTC